MTRLLIETADLTKRYGRRAALDHVCLQVRGGEVYAFLGPSGAGKTTTLGGAGPPPGCRLTHPSEGRT